MPTRDQLDILNFVIAACGAVVASILAIFQLSDYRYGTSRLLNVFTNIAPKFDALEIDITNVGRRPVRVAAVSVRYGPEPAYAQTVERVVVDKKLEEGDPVVLSIPRATLVNAVAQKQLPQQQFARVWLTIETPGRPPLYRPVRISDKIITQPFYERARDYIAADLFLGYPQKPSEFFLIGVK